MPRKKSIKSIARQFQGSVDAIADYFSKTEGLRAAFAEWCADYAVIRLYREFENLMLGTLSGAINNDATTISTTVGIAFPKHMSESVTRYLIVGTGYFDFRGRDGLISLVKEYVPESHYLVVVLKDSKYKDALERLSAFRNLAAHDSEKAKKAARKAIGGGKIGSAGSWLRRQDRFKVLSSTLKELAVDIERKAPY